MSYLDVNKEIKSRLPIPSFTGDTALTFKSISNTNYKQSKKLLFVAKSSNETDLSREEKQKEDLLSKKKIYYDSSEKEYLVKDKFSLSEKLAEIYLESAKKKTARNGCFIKCNYLEELVVHEDLSYFIMKIYPSKLFLYFKNSNRVNFFYHAKIDEEYDFFDSIDNGEIPTCIFGQIMLCENWFLMYDYHCFLQIQKYAFEDECAQPVFSDFVLLKPTTKLLIDLVNKSAYDTNNNNGSSHEELKENYESKIYFEISGPLYLDVNPAALELMNLLKIYQSPFGYTSLKVALAKRPVSVNKQSFKPNDFKEELLKVLEEKIPQPSSFPEETDFQLNGSPFSYVDTKEDLQTYLVDRSLDISDNLYISQTTTLVEVFELMTPKKNLTGNGYKQCTDNIKKYLSVFWKYGQFYSCLTLDKYSYDPDDQNDFLILMGSREELDRYILKVAEILSCRFTKLLGIEHKNMLNNTSRHFFLPLLDPKMISEYDEKDFVTSHINGTEKTRMIRMKDPFCIEEVNIISHKNLDFLEKYGIYDETDYTVKANSTSDEELDNLVHGIIDETDSIVGNLQRSNLKVSDSKKKEISSDLDCCETDILNRRKFEDIFSSVTESQETSEIQSDSLSSVFDTHLLEKEKNTDSDSPSEISYDFTECFPSLKSKFEFSKEDFMKDIIHDHSEDMKKLLEMISRI